MAGWKHSEKIFVFFCLLSTTWSLGPGRPHTTTTSLSRNLGMFSTPALPQPGLPLPGDALGPLADTQGWMCYAPVFWQENWNSQLSLRIYLSKNTNSNSKHITWRVQPLGPFPCQVVHVLCFMLVFKDIALLLEPNQRV